MLFRIPGVAERTFDVDLITGGTPGTPPDGGGQPGDAGWQTLAGQHLHEHEEAVAAEDYERAAELHERIRELESE